MREGAYGRARSLGIVIECTILQISLALSLAYLAAEGHAGNPILTLAERRRAPGAVPD
jgi:hypothetical protein